MGEMRRFDEPALIPEHLAEELLETFRAIGPFARMVPHYEIRPLGRWGRLRLRAGIVRASVRRWMLWRLFPAEARALESYENEDRW